MTEPAAASGRSKVPGLLIGAQARTSAGAIAIATSIVAVAVFVAAAVPVLAAQVTRDQVRVDLDTAGARADVVVSVPLASANSPVLELIPDTAGTAAYIVERLDAGMPPGLGTVLGEPITTLVSPELKMGSFGGLPARARFAYVVQGAEPIVTWVDGTAPGRTGSPEDVLDSQTKTTIQVGISQAVADALGVGVGDTLPVEDPDAGPLDVIVTGIYEPVGGAEAFATVPTLLAPRASQGPFGQLSVGLLATAESLPAARLGAQPATMLRYFTYPVNSEAITADNAREVETLARGLATGKQTFDVVAEMPRVDTRLDVILGAALDRSSAAAAQAAVLLLAVLALVALTQLLAASVMIEQRSPVLRQLGARGASVAGVGRALAVESVIATAAGTAVGLGLQQVFVPGAVSWGWVVTPIAVAALAAPLLAMRAARQRRLPRAAGSRRGRALSTPALRRLTATIALAVAAAIGIFALRARGTASSQGSIAADLIVLAAPALCAITAGIIVAWALPRLAQALRALMGRARGEGPLLTASRMRAPGTAVVALVLAGTVASMAASVALTAREGLATAAWDAVGADAVAVAGASEALPDAPRAEGDAVWAPAAPLGSGHLAGGPKSQAVQVVAVDARRLADLAARLPGADPEAWDTLARAQVGEDGSVPMLQSADLVGVPAGTLTWGQNAVAVSRIGDAPDLPGTAADAATLGSESVVIVDRATLAEARDTPLPATVVWVAGPDAEDILAAEVTESTAQVTTPESWRAATESAPVTQALKGLFAGSIVAALALAGLGVALLIAAGSPERARAMGRLRVVGLSQRRVRTIARGEVSLPVVVASLAGVAVGLILTVVLAGSLGLQSVTGQARAPQPVLAWWSLMVPLAVGGFAWIAVGVGLRLGRTPRLGEVLRVS